MQLFYTSGNVKITQRIDWISRKSFLYCYSTRIPQRSYFHEILLFPTPSSSRNRHLCLVHHGHHFEHCAVVRLARLTKLDCITSKNVLHMTKQQEM